MTKKKQPQNLTNTVNGAVEAGQHITAHNPSSLTENTKPDDRKPVIVNAWMSAMEMVKACGLTLRRSTMWTYSIYSPSGEQLHTSTMTGIKAWLRREKYVV